MDSKFLFAILIFLFQQLVFADTANPRQQLHQLQVSSLEMRTQYIETRGFERTTFFSVKLCFPTKDFSIVSAKDFEITRYNGKRLLKPANFYTQGCFYWMDDSIDWNYFAPECLQPGSIQLRSQSQNIQSTIPVQISPSSPSLNGEIWYREGSRARLSSQEIPCPKDRSRLSARAPNLSTLQYRHSLDPLLNLGVFKKVQANIPLALERPSLRSPTGEYREVPIPYGKYIFRYAIVNQYFFEKFQENRGLKDDLRARILEDQRAFMYAEKEIEIRRLSSLQETLELFTWNLREMGNNNLLIFEIKPKYQNEKVKVELEPTLFQTPLILSGDMANGNAIPITERLSFSEQVHLLDEIKMMHEADIRNNREALLRRTGKTAFALTHGLDIVNLNDATGKFLNQRLAKQFVLPGVPTKDSFEQDLADLVDKGTASKTFFQRTCVFWFQELLKRTLPELNDRAPLKEKSVLSWGLLTGDFKDLKTVVGECQQIVGKNPQDFFEIHHHYFTGPIQDLQYLGAVNNRLSIAEGMNVARSYNFTKSESLGLDAGSSLKFDNWMFWQGRNKKTETALAGPGSKNTWSDSMRLMATNKNYWLFNPQPFSAGLKWVLYRNFADSQSLGNSGYVNQMTNFKIERLHFSLRTRDFEKCTSLRLNTRASLENDTLIGNILKQGDLPHPSALEAVMKKGLLICKGVRNPNLSEKLFESYYTFNADETHNMTAADPYTLLNRPYFMKLRGDQDFLNFLSMIYQSVEIPNYEHQDPTANKIFGGQTQIWNLIKQFIPYVTAPYQMKVSSGEVGEQIRKFNDQNSNVMLGRLREIFLKDQSLRGLRTFPGHIMKPVALDKVQKEGDE